MSPVPLIKCLDQVEPSLTLRGEHSRNISSPISVEESRWFQQSQIAWVAPPTFALPGPRSSTYFQESPENSCPPCCYFVPRTSQVGSGRVCLT